MEQIRDTSSDRQEFIDSKMSFGGPQAISVEPKDRGTAHFRKDSSPNSSLDTSKNSNQALTNSIKNSGVENMVMEPISERDEMSIDNTQSILASTD
jgi:hypothetical protein